MPSRDLMGAVRRARAGLLTPKDREVEPSVRGFEPWEGGPGIVEDVGRAFLTGYRTMMECGTATDACGRLGTLENQWRGFAVEGAGMAAAVRSMTEPWSRGTFKDLVVYCGERHGYMIYVGLGWALARLPRILWPRLHRFDPGAAPLVLDGFGFHEAFFHTSATLARGPRRFPTGAWPGPAEHVTQQVHQGVGRALWFVCGGSPRRLAATIGRFDEDLHSSLWAGTGLAAAYAGGRDRAGLVELVDAAGEHHRWLRQGAAFAVEARVNAGTVVDHTGIAAEYLIGGTVDDVTAAVRAARPAGQALDSGDWSAYEVWRHDLAGALVAV